MTGQKAKGKRQKAKKGNGLKVQEFLFLTFNF